VSGTAERGHPVSAGFVVTAVAGSAAGRPGADVVVLVVVVEELLLELVEVSVVLVVLLVVVLLVVVLLVVVLLVSLVLVSELLVLVVLPHVSLVLGEVVVVLGEVVVVLGEVVVVLGDVESLDGEVVVEAQGLVDVVVPELGELVSDGEDDVGGISDVGTVVVELVGEASAVTWNSVER
jgi:hypothetical protein